MQKRLEKHQTLDDQSSLSKLSAGFINPETQLQQEEDDDDDLNLQFKDQVPANSTTIPQQQILVHDPNYGKEIDRGVHFKVCMGTHEQTFSIYEFYPYHKLKDLKELSIVAQIRQADYLSFYYCGVRLRDTQKLRDIQYALQKNDKTKPILIYTKNRPFEEFTTIQLKDHFNVVIVRNDLPFYQNKVIKQKIEFEREKLRKLKEVYQVAIDKTQNCRFFVRDFIEYIKKVLALQLNVTKMSQEEKFFVKEKGLAFGKIEAILFQKIEGIDRALFMLATVQNVHDVDMELKMLQTFLPMQVLNNKYRKELKRAYDITEEFDEELMNNKVYGAVTDGTDWYFLLYEHSYYAVQLKIVHQARIDVKNFFNSLHEIVKVVINLCADLIFNKFSN